MWLITQEQMSYYTTQFRSMQPNLIGVIPGTQVYTFFFGLKQGKKPLIASGFIDFLIIDFLFLIIMLWLFFKKVPIVQK